MSVSLDELFCVNSPQVVSETIDGEAIIMHHGTGHYFNTTGTGALIWQAIEQGASAPAIAGRLAAAFEVNEAGARAAVSGFVAALEANDLVRRAPAGPAAAFGPPAVKAAFAEPELHVHTDLADMLLLDPIHEVDETGWPAPGKPR